MFITSSSWNMEKLKSRTSVLVKFVLKLYYEIEKYIYF